MLIGTWNLNNRVGKVRFRPEAADAAVALGTDILVLTEFYPQQHEETFVSTLREGGLVYQKKSLDTGEIANRVLIASRRPLQPLELPLPRFDLQFPANISAATADGLSVIGIRIPWYSGPNRKNRAQPHSQ